MEVKRKLGLNLDELTVESFDTGSEDEANTALGSSGSYPSDSTCSKPRACCW